MRPFNTFRTSSSDEQRNRERATEWVREEVNDDEILLHLEIKWRRLAGAG